MDQVVGELPGFIESYREQSAAMDAGLAVAESTLRAWALDPEAGNRELERAMADSREPFAVAREESPMGTFDPPDGGPITVVAADGSSIEPDRFAPVQCYVINSGYVVLPYGVPAVEPRLNAQAVLGPELPALANSGRDDGSEDTSARSWGVSLRRDVHELEVGVWAALPPLESGPVVLLYDGTLLPWDLDSPDVAAPIRTDLQQRTNQALDDVREAGAAISLGAYVSGSRARDLVTSLAALAPGDTRRWPEADSQLMYRLLRSNQRSAVFEARSKRRDRIEEQFSSHQVCFFYLRIGDDIARVELPHWATTPDRLGRLHSTLVDQCQRCGGYPRALQEAHEQAVISAGDRLQFSLLLERAAARQGLQPRTNSKQMSKRRRAL
jgi:hypothetical protein